jgi:hypothetical protein
MENQITHNSFEATADRSKGTTRICLVKDGVKTDSVDIDTKETSRIAGILLGLAREAHRGKQPVHSSKEDEVNLTVVSPSGLNIGPGRKPTSVILMFHFGETTQGIEVPKSDALTFAQRLMNASAEGTPH